VPATELVLRRLLPMAHEGLQEWGVDAVDRDRLLGIIEGRCLTGRNGAQWQSATFPPVLRRARPARRLARDDAGVRRPHAQQRAGAHLADRLSDSQRQRRRGRRAPCFRPARRPAAPPPEHARFAVALTPVGRACSCGRAIAARRSIEHARFAVALTPVSRACSGGRAGLTSADPAALVGDPGAEQAAEVRDELVVLVVRERAGDCLDEHAVEVGLSMYSSTISSMSGSREAQKSNSARCRIVVGHRAIGAQLVVVGEVVPVGDGEPRSRIDVRVTGRPVAVAKIDHLTSAFMAQGK